MEEGRTYPARKRKVRLILDGRFKDLFALKAGDKGQMIVEMDLKGMDLEMDSDLNQRIEYMFLITKAEVYDSNKGRV